MIEPSVEEQQRLIESLESIVEAYKFETVLLRKQRDELATLVRHVRSLLIEGKPNAARMRIDAWLMPIEPKLDPVEDEIARVMT